MDTIMDIFTEHDRLVILEIAKLALMDADTFDQIAEYMDIADEDMANSIYKESP